MSEAHSRFGAGGLKSRSTKVVGDPNPPHAERRAELPPLHIAREARGAHQPLDPLAPDPDVLVAKVEVDPPGAVAVTAARVHLPDPLAQPRVDQPPLRRRPLLPGMEA